MKANLFDRYDPDSKLAIYYAVQLATHRGKKAISPEDLLVGLTWRNHDHDCQFGALKADADKLWAGVGVPHLPVSSTPYSISRIPLDKRSNWVLRRMRTEANASGQYWIDIDHMLIGLLEENGLAAQSLEEAGWTKDRIRSAAAYGRSRYTQRPIPKLSSLRLFWDRRGRWIALGGAMACAVTAFLYLRSQN